MAIKVKCSKCGKEKVVYNKQKYFVCCNQRQKITEETTSKPEISQPEPVSVENKPIVEVNEEQLELIEPDFDSENEEKRINEVFHCPECNAEVEEFGDCSKCGAVLIWSEE